MLGSIYRAAEVRNTDTETDEPEDSSSKSKDRNRIKRVT